ncbi:MAG: hypothetical protein ACXW3D_00035 [Caulobacteraceae bacterium]
MIILGRDEIEARLAALDLIEPVEQALAAYSRGDTLTPPPGEMLFDAPQGEVHIKCGWMSGFDCYVVKVASGFYGNAALGLPSSDGLMLLFDRATGQPVALLQDRGYLTDMRTAAAGAVFARHLAPAKVSAIGVIGAGIQARLQVKLVQAVRPCRRVFVWARREAGAQAYVDDMARDDFEVEALASPAEVAARCELVVTATPAAEPLLQAADVRPGQHITAMGADTPLKRELGPGLLDLAHLVAVDSLEQCRARGDLRHAVAEGFDGGRAVEIGALIEAGRAIRAEAPGAVTVGLLTGLGVQDLAAAAAVVGRCPQPVEPWPSGR